MSLLTPRGLRLVGSALASRHRLVPHARSVPRSAAPGRAQGPDNEVWRRASAQSGAEAPRPGGRVPPTPEVLACLPEPVGVCGVLGWGFVGSSFVFDSVIRLESGAARAPVRWFFMMEKSFASSSTQVNAAAT